MQAQLMQTMQQNMMNMQQGQNQQQAPPPRDRLGDLQRTKPPTFSHSVDPLDADDWLKTIEKKLQVVQCTDREMVLYASHQLEGTTADWWETYVGNHEAPNAIT